MKNPVIKAFARGPLLLALLLATTTIPIAAGQSIRMGVTPFDWTDDMKATGLTTIDRGLILKITATNQDTQNRFRVELLTISIRGTKNSNEQLWLQSMEVRNTVIPPGQEIVLWYDVRSQLSSWGLGEYSLDISSNYGQVEPYPFKFRVVGSEEEMKRQIAEKRTGPQFNLSFPIDISILGGAAVSISIALAYWKRPKR